jgi:phosphatidylglycerol:prolipoprotein diacylglycerol transferase
VLAGDAIVPYVDIPALRVGAVVVSPFAITALAATVVGVRQTLARATALGLEHERVDALLNVVLVAGLVGAHLTVLAGQPEIVRRDPWALVRVWDGLSAVGGIGAGALAAFVLASRRGIDRMTMLDALAYGLAPAWIVARFGCVLVHDHPGRLTTFPLAVAHPDAPPGIGRHDLGLYEVGVAIVLTVVMRAMARRATPRGMAAAAFLGIYAAARLGLDVLRATDVAQPDPRWLGLTPTQWVAVPVLLGALAWLRRHR